MYRLVLLALLLSACSTQDPAFAQDAPPAPGALAAEVPTVPLTPTPIRVTIADLPEPFATSSARKGPRVVDVPDDATLRVPEGFRVQVFASDLEAPRWLALTPEGDVLVAESRADRITRLSDRDGDGVAEARETFASSANALDQPFGMAFADGAFFVANTGEVRRYPYAGGPLAGQGNAITQLTPGGYNQHWTRNVIAGPDGWLYVSVGSESNVSPEELPRASVQRMRPDGSERTTYASGLRNPVGLAIHPQTGALYTTVNERDGLGDGLVPDYLARVDQGAFYGWPYTYLTPDLLDPRRLDGNQSERPDLAAQTRTPEVLFESHSAALGVQFYDQAQFPDRYRGGAFVAFRGSWNRSEGTGYKVVYVPFDGNDPAGHYEDFLTGFLLDPSGPTTFARPVGLLVLPDGSLLVTDDGNGRIYRISYAG
jgi:glucose/arabinose dehydrogenase